MDALRGFAIALVLLWHAPSVPVLLGSNPMPDWLLAVNNFFLPFRMPLLMFLSGMLIDRSLSKPIGAYYLGKIRLLAWPYVIFAALHITLYGRGLELSNPRSYVATGYLWFLFFVAGCYFLAPALKRVPPILLVLGCGLTSVALEGAWGTGHRFTYYALFFFLGQSAVRAWPLVRRLFDPPALWVVVIVAICFGAVSAANDIDAFQRDARYAPLSAAGILAAVAMAQRLPTARLVRAVETVGRNSIVYYTTHFPIMLVTSGALIDLGWRNPLTHLPINLCLAWLFGWCLVRWRRSHPIDWLFEMPLPRRRVA